jgi:hypothetical protein
MMKLFLTTLASSILVSFAAAEEAASAPEPKKEKPRSSGWNLQLVPRGFQKNPNLDITVISELSAAGKQRPIVSTENPVYYVMQPGGYRPRGDAMNQKPFPAEEVEKILRRALAASGYRPATEEHLPSIVVIYTWGAHNLIDSESALSSDHIIRNILDRAALAGGDKFATELAEAIKASNAMAEASAVPLGPLSEGSAITGAAAAFEQMSALADPVRLFKQRSSKNDFLVNQATSNCYYLIASAFDYEAMAASNRQLLWRTRMTVSANGVSQLEAIPMMISVSTPYLGRDMPESEIISKRAVLKGQVEMGAPTVVEPPPSKTLEKK